MSSSSFLLGFRIDSSATATVSFKEVKNHAVGCVIKLKILMFGEMFETLLTSSNSFNVHLPILLTLLTL